jgi:hypothetical protein
MTETKSPIEIFQDHVMDHVWSSRGKIEYSEETINNKIAAWKAKVRADLNIDRWESHWFASGQDRSFDPARKRPKAEALTFPYVGINYGGYHRFIVIDVDHTDAYSRAFGCTASPNFIVENPVTGKAHCFWLLEKAVWVPKTEGGRVASPVWALKSFTWALLDRMGGDPAFKGFLVKNPLNPKWETTILHWDPWTFASLKEALGDIDDSVERHKPAYMRRQAVAKLDEEDKAIGRNQAIFSALSKWGRATKHNYQSEDEHRAGAAIEADRLNKQFHPGLPRSEINGLVKGVIRWVWNKWSGYAEPDKNRGAAQISPDIVDIRERQQHGQAYSAGIKHGNKLKRLQEALDDLLRRGVRVTQRVLSEVSGIAVRTVQFYWKEVTGCTGRFLNRHVAPRVKKAVRSVAKLLPNRMSQVEYPESLSCDITRTPPEFEDWEEFFDYHRRLGEEERRVEFEARWKAKMKAKAEKRKKPKTRPVLSITRDLDYGVQKVQIGRSSYRLPISWTQNMIWAHHRHGTWFN